MREKCFDLDKAFSKVVEAKVPPVPGVIANTKKFQLDLTIIPVPIRIWDLNLGERFCLSEDGFNEVEQRYEIYIKISKTKAIIESLTHKPIVSIPKLGTKDIAYKLIEEFKLSDG